MTNTHPSCPSWCRIRDCAGSRWGNHWGDVDDWPRPDRDILVAIRSTRTGRPEILVQAEGWTEDGDAVQLGTATMSPVVALATGFVAGGRIGTALLSAAAQSRVPGLPRRAEPVTVAERYADPISRMRIISAPPMVRLITNTPGSEHRIELTYEQVDTLADFLCLAKAPLWLWRGLVEASQMAERDTA
ncbi:hypothetical protein [Actinomadura flavalba]|uniref:hypothetical protein n=1 Tax=Actinomadura flavalba TaxID=1120938 RepID=UPI00037FDF8C|nr:hypothetical protein [Actinomadura flavalba]